jgi:hypothetical protein
MRPASRDEKEEMGALLIFIEVRAMPEPQEK